MKRWGMLFRVVMKAFSFRPGKASSCLAALTVGATLSSAFLSLYFVLPGKMSEEFRTLGANLVVTPSGNAQTFSQDLFTRLGAQQPQVFGLPWLYAIGKTAKGEVVLGGTDLSRVAFLNPGWKVVANEIGTTSNQTLEEMLGRNREAAGQQNWLVAGEKAASQFGWRVGEPVELNYGEKSIRLPLLAVISTGGSEDSQALVPISALQELTSQPGRLSLIQMRAPGPAAQVEMRRQEIAALLSDVEVRPLRPVIESEARVVMKVRALMYGLTAVVLGIVILSVMSTVSGLVLDRQRDIGIIKTLGGSDFMISFLFMTELAVSALLAAVLGYLLGFGLADWAAHDIFHSSLPWRWDVLASVAAVSIAVALASTAFPIHLVGKLEPAVILKGN